MDARDLRIALFSGNYNYIRDGANQALNRLVAYLLGQGAAVRVYSPTVEKPAFEPAGDLVSVPALPLPGRGEYRAPLMIPSSVKRDILAFRPNIIHVSSPEILGHRAVTFAHRHNIPAVASVHTRFETYFRYYGAGWIEPVIVAALRRFYRRCDAIFAPSESMAELLREQGMNDHVGIWSRGIDRTIFNPGRRDLAWRRSLGIEDDMPVIGFTGRLVMEKGLDVFSGAVALLEERGVRHKVLVVGDGPARGWFEEHMPRAIYVGHQTGEDLGRAVASMDVFFNPSVTETFGNVTLEAMATGQPVVAARATGSASLVQEGVTGHLVDPADLEGYAAALTHLCNDSQARAAAGQAGELASRRYGWDEVNQAIVDGYFEVLARRGAQTKAA